MPHVVVFGVYPDLNIDPRVGGGFGAGDQACQERAPTAVCHMVALHTADGFPVDLPDPGTAPIDGVKREVELVGALGGLPAPSVPGHVRHIAGSDVLGHTGAVR